MSECLSEFCEVKFVCFFKFEFDHYSRLPITRTFKGNRKRFELSGVRVIESSKKIAGSKEKNSFYCTVSILITFNSKNVE